MDRSQHSRAVDQAALDMQKVIASFDADSFMSEKSSPRTQKRRELLATMAPDLQQMQADGMPAYLLERLARMDKD